jgi:hypothetical protein
LTYDFPVLPAGPTPWISLDRWRFTLTTETGEQKSWNWQEFTSLPTEDRLVPADAGDSRGRAAT